MKTGVLTRIRALLAALWLGMLLTVGGIATPAPFATLARAQAGLVAGRVLASEAAASLVLGALLLALDRMLARGRADGEPARGAFSAELLLTLGAVLCTVVGYYALLPWLDAARAGQGRFSFGQLHAASSAIFIVKIGLVAILAWRSGRGSS